MSSGSAFAQTADENRDADALAADMRLLATNPLDIEALIKAGELTLRMGDNTAAAGFFGRAEKLDPLNPRIKAGLGSLLVRAERPGEALRRFQEAEARGLDPRNYAADRGFAYDLIGEQERAQRDYRLALQAGPNDEVTRRYALSLAISGRKKEALDLLDPLLRRSDRAAWRDRAFVLAMSGDREDAQKIADSMMSPGLGAGLAPFFERLPTLSAVDRAFAVNFGELRATPERIADARMVPALPRLGPDPTAPKVLAVAEPVRPRATADDGKKRKKRRKDEDLAPAVPTPAPARAPVEVAMNAPRYAPPPTQPAPQPSPLPPARVVTPPPASRPQFTPAPPPPVKVAEVPRPTPKPVPVAPSASAPATMAAQPPAATPVKVATAVAPAPAPGFRSTVSGGAVADQPSAAEAGVAPTATSRVSEDTVLAKIIAGISVPGSELGIAPIQTRAAPPPPPSPTPRPAEEARPLAKAPEPRTAIRKTSREEAAGVSDTRMSKAAKATTAKEEAATLDQNGCPPLSAKGRTGRRGKAAARGRSTGKCETADAKAARESKPDSATFDPNGCPPLSVRGKAGARGKVAARGRSAGKCETADTNDTRKSQDAVALDKNGCPVLTAKGKAGKRGKPGPVTSTRGKTTARGKASNKCETADAKEAKAEAAVKGEPARIWVQVAGGANQATLEKAWAAVKAKAPDLFRNRQGWSTPLRATNRVLTGPFKSTEEAQAFVNQLSKAGLSGFVFSSTKGQKVDRLGGK